MKVLLFGQWYRPEPAYGLQDIAQELRKRSHCVTVLTGFPNYPSGKVYPGYSIRHWQREILAGVLVVRVPLYPDHSHSKIRRALNYLSFAFSSSVLGPLLLDKPDVMFVYHPPLTVGIPAYVMSRVWRIPFIYQIQDMWPETLQATGMVNSERLLDGIGRLAKWIYSKADAICVISPGFRSNLITKGVSSSKVHVIPNWVDVDKYCQVPPNPQKARELGLSNTFNIMFAGNMGEAQGLETVINAANILKEGTSIQFVFVGDGVALPRMKEMVRQYGLNNIRFLGRFPAEEMPHIFALADVLLVHLRDDSLFRITIPHKILSYLAVGKPILAAISGDAGDVIEKTKSGLICPPANSQALAATVLEFFEMPASERETLGQNGRIAATTHFSKEKLVEEIESLMTSLVTSNDLTP